jgi:hypothetical protein
MIRAKILNCVALLSVGVGFVLALGFTPVAFAEETVKTVKPIWGAESARTPPSHSRKKPTTSTTDEAVDLGSLTADTPSAPSQMSGMSSASGRNFHKASGAMPNFKFYFDFLYAYRPGLEGRGNQGFDSFHQVILVDINPTPELSFMTELNGAPRFYEVDYKTSDRMTIRWGKIWVPFDDMSPHNIFGGRINTSEFFEGFTDAQAFLPDLWADLGVGLRYQFVDTSALSAVGHLYVVNGFGDGGREPAGSGSDYPSFGNIVTGPDNNNSKSLGGRAHLKFFQRLGLGASFYRGAWTDKEDPSQSISMYGFDAQLQPTSITELRAGIVYMTVGLNPPATKSSFSRGGMYVEFGQKFGTDSRWKFLGRAGIAQNDNRVIDITDKKLLGATLLRNLGAVEISAHFSRDFEKVANKPSYNYGALRVVTAF